VTLTGALEAEAPATAASPAAARERLQPEESTEATRLQELANENSSPVPMMMDARSAPTTTTPIAPKRHAHSQNHHKVNPEELRREIYDLERLNPIDDAEYDTSNDGGAASLHHGPAASAGGTLRDMTDSSDAEEADFPEVSRDTALPHNGRHSMDDGAATANAAATATGATTASAAMTPTRRAGRRVTVTENVRVERQTVYEDEDFGPNEGGRVTRVVQHVEEDDQREFGDEAGVLTRVTRHVEQENLDRYIADAYDPTEGRISHVTRRRTEDEHEFTVGAAIEPAAEDATDDSIEGEVPLVRRRITRHTTEELNEDFEELTEDDLAAAVAAVHDGVDLEAAISNYANALTPTRVKRSVRRVSDVRDEVYDDAAAVDGAGPDAAEGLVSRVEQHIEESEEDEYYSDGEDAAVGGAYDDAASTTTGNDGRSRFANDRGVTTTRVSRVKEETEDFDGPDAGGETQTSNPGYVTSSRTTARTESEETFRTRDPQPAASAANAASSSSPSTLSSGSRRAAVQRGAEL
jgi:hypothetical protein